MTASSLTQRRNFATPNIHIRRASGLSKPPLPFAAATTLLYAWLIFLKAGAHMLSINDLKRGSLVMIDGAPFEVLEIAHQHIGRGGSSAQTKIRHCVTGQVLSRNYKQADAFKEAEIEKKPMVFLYRHRGAFVLADPDDQSRRVTLSAETVGENAQWLKPTTAVTAVYLENKIISLNIPIKMDLKVTEAPPGLRGDTAQGGAKPVRLETGAVVQAPLFISQDDVIRINTETGTYVERVEKA